ncbi:hypothetical protein ANAEL_03900 [Anaerolineales bacterium]|nr:hypothetical protein ANAEL_03900 [Anaerolineales bacterium]
MTTWTSEELNKIGTAEELQIASLRHDGTLRKPVIIWVVRVGDELYVRSVNGRTSAWFRGVRTRQEGQIRAGGVVKDVTFVEESDSNINDQIDAAYATKYRRYAASIINSIISPEACSATIKLVPRSTSSQFNNCYNVPSRKSKRSGTLYTAPAPSTTDYLSLITVCYLIRACS